MKKYVTLILALCALLTVLTGCSDSTLTEPVNAAFVLGITNNNPVVNLDMEEFSSMSAVGGSTYTCVLSDGTPHEIVSGTIPDFTDMGYTSEMLDRISQSVKADLTAQLNGACPDADEVDVAEALKLAVRFLRANAVEGRQNLLVMHLSGLGTKGAIDMTKTPVASMDVSASVTTLSQTLDMDLTGIDVVIYCLGDVTGDQKPLSDGERVKLREFYEELLFALGANSVVFPENTPLSGCYDFNHTVSCMDTADSDNLLSEEAVTVSEPTPEPTPVPEPTEVFAEEGILSFDGASVAFTSGTAELADPDAAEEALSYVIDYMKGNPNFSLLVCGTTACWGGAEYCRDLSFRRAEAVCDLLISHGISPDRLTVLGLGYESEFYLWDQTPDGELDEALASVNRSVKLVDPTSEIGLRILAKQ